MTKEEVRDLMASSKSDQEWNDNASQVKEAFGGLYPDFWFTEIIQSGFSGLIIRRFNYKNRRGIQPIGDK